jgi:DNA-binding response OmpR family regulator
MTADDHEDNRSKAVSLAANDFVLKPIITKEFIPRVRRFIAS